MAQADKPKVLFVLGGPGAGKGTQCTKVVENYTSWAHVSAGDCLRAERNDPSSKDGELINGIIKEGKLVPSAITVKLLLKAMAKAKQDGKTHFLVDGFPRSVENLDTWKAEAGNAAIVCGILFYEAKEDELEKRLLARGQTSGRVDDNIESIRKRFRTYMDETMPIIEKFKAEGKVFSIDGMPPEEDVWKVTKAKIEEVEQNGRKQASSCHLPPLIICGPSGVGKGTLIERLKAAFPGRFGFSVSHTTRAPRPGEVDGVSYHFTELEIMKREVEEKGKFVEYAHVHGNIYGTSKAAVEAVMQQGKICLLDIDVQGVQKVKESGAFPDAKFIFVKAPSMEELEKRLRGRGTEKEEAVQKRLKGAQAEIDFCDKNPSYWNCVLVNNDLENSTRELLSVIRRLYPSLAQNTKAPPAPRKGGLLRLLMCGCGN